MNWGIDYWLDLIINCFEKHQKGILPYIFLANYYYWGIASLNCHLPVKYSNTGQIMGVCEPMHTEECG